MGNKMGNIGDKRIVAAAALVASLLLGAGCGAAMDAVDRLLFGGSVDDPVAASTSPAQSCASEIAVTTTNVDLVEDGDVTRTYSTSDPYVSDTDADGGTAWGFRSVETCVYLVNSFNGTVEIPISSNSTYSGRLDIKTSFPVAASGDWPGSNQNLPSKLVFTGNGTTGHGNTSRQCFTVARINDGAQNPIEDARVISLGEITKGDNDAKYTGKNPCDVSATMEDDERPGVRVSNISNIMEEPGGGSGLTSGTFRVRLRTAPAVGQNVTVPINALYDSKNAGNREGTVNKTSLVFDSTNYNIEQVVTVTSVDDLQLDGTVQYTIQMQNTVSTDSTYNGLNPRDVVIINQDQSIPGYVYTRFDATGGQTNKSTGATVSGFATDEMNNMGTAYSHFTIRLRSKPSADVTLNFSTNNTAISEVATTSLTFTPTNWDTAQTVYVNGKSNGADGGSGNGNVDYTISFTVTTTDSSYSNPGTVARPTFVMRSCDNDGTHEIQPCNLSGSPFGDSRGRLSGAEPSATTYMWLITKASPGSAVTVPLTSTDTTEGTLPANVTIDSSNYNVLGTGTNRIALSHADDALLDNSVNWDVTTGAATGGLTYNTADVLATTTDDEQRYTITKSGNTHENETTTATVEIYLAAQNDSQVTMTVGCSSLGDECLSVSPTSITWNAGESGVGFKKTITVTGKDDTFADGDVSFNVTFSVDSGSDPIFLGNNPSSQSITNVDNEQPGKAIYVTANSYNGEMSGIGGGADALCNGGTKPAYVPSGTYKALMVRDAATDRRIATTTGTDATGQTGWVLTANYHYYLCTGSGAANCSDEHKRLFVANSAALIPFPMSIDFSGSDTFWTGMNVNMTPATQSSTPAKFLDDPDYRDNCAGWTYTNAPNSPSPAYYGQTWSKNALGTVNSNTNVACTSTYKLICVQQ